MTSKVSGAQRWLGPIALALAATLVALSVGELGARILFRKPPPPDSPARPRPAHLIGLKEIKGLGNLMAPNVRGLLNGVLYRTNSLGVRGPEYAAIAPAGVFRILVIGDSVTMGPSVAEEHVYSRVLGDLLAERRPQLPVEVINIGVAGFSIHHVIWRLRDLGLRYHPDLVIYGFTLNDIEGPAYVKGEPAARQAMAAEMERFRDSPSRLLAAMWPRWIQLRTSLKPVPGTYEWRLKHNYFEVPAAWSHVTDQLDDLAATLATEKICGVVFVHVWLSNLRWLHPFGRIYDQVEAAALERGFSVIQSYPYVRGRNEDELRVSVFDSHPNKAGHRAFGEALADGLTELPEHCWRGRPNAAKRASR